MNAKVDFDVRKGRLKDAETVTKLWKELHGQHVEYFPNDFGLTKGAFDMHTQWWKTCVRSRTKCTFVVELDKEIIGYLMGGTRKRPPVLKIGEEANVWDVYVNDDYRGIGVGAALMEEFFQWARDKKVSMVTLQVSPPNRRGVDFYKKLGFETVLQVERKMI
jgi:ribosomal protein S18 acetylase RimI-like enzyme